ncbi:MAG TPA: imidazole glycerol phosphate synthase subunit HisH [Bacteroidales bacterium]|nr:imidazole glycerol phosphate synthase subunit HisH [Bacteroidales bacterium]
MNIAIIKYNAGNIMSVQYALARLGYEAVVTDNPGYIRHADRVIFPGVGEASTTMAFLKKHGFDELLRELSQPVLGICLGQQLMCTHSTEGDTDCIGIFDVEVKRFEARMKVPHIGWNSLAKTTGRLFAGIPDNSYVYFVHSYYVPVCSSTAAECEYITPFSAALEKDNFFATQFHPEKSGEVGQKILENFIQL